MPPELNDEFEVLSVTPLNPGDPPPSMSGTRVVVPVGARPPEFVVGVYDDAAFLRPRPLRFGVPVISTVPVDGSGVTSVTTESEWIRLGVGPQTRVVYFKILCNQAIETLATGKPSSLVRLNIYEPDSLDTLKPAIPVQLRVVSDVSSNIQYYYGSYTFHREDTVDFVDGFIYLVVSPALTMSLTLPIKLQVSRVGGYTPPPYEADRQQSADAISAFSLHGQQAFNIVSAFSAAADTAV